VVPPWRSFPTMVALGLVVGLLTGGYPPLASQVSTVALIAAMTFSLTEVRVRGIRLRAEVRPVVGAFLLNYVACSGYLLGVSVLFVDPSLRVGWIVQAAVPSAIAVVPFVSAVRGNVRTALVATGVLYVGSILLLPAITLAFAGTAVSPIDVAVQTVLLILVPLGLSRAFIRIPRLEAVRPTIVNFSLAALVVMVVGASRNVFFEDFDVLAIVGLAAVGRTFLLGGIVLFALRSLHRSRDEVIGGTAFASFKNLGLTALLSLSLIGPEAVVPAVVTLFTEIAWVAVLARVLRPPRTAGALPRTPEGERAG